MIQELQLSPLTAEGGYFKVLYRSPKETKIGDGSSSSRVLASSIFFALSGENHVNYLHKNHSDILHFFLKGSPIKYVIITPDGQCSTTILGQDIQAGQKLHLAVPGGNWLAAELLYSNGSVSPDYGLISEVVCPGFEDEDRSMATLDDLKMLLPQDWQKLKHFIKDFQHCDE